MATVQMAKDWNATYPQVGDTGADAPAGYITLWADFFTHGNLRLPVTVFVAEVLEYYHLHISQLSPFGMFRIRNFEYTFRAYGLPISVENFRRFYQLTVNTGFFSFTQRHGSLKLMTPPKGVTGWKKRFFYVKACAVYANMSFRNVDVGVSDEDIPVASAETADWFSRLRPIELKKLDNDQLWILRMMLSRPDRKERPVLREQGGADAVGLWRMFEPDFKGQVELIAVELKKGFNLEILKNFRVPSKAVLEAPVPGDARGVLADLGKFEKRVPKRLWRRKRIPRCGAEVQAREVAVTDLNARVSVAENRADAAVEAKDALGENPEQPIVAEEEDEDDDVNVPGGGLPVLKWTKGSFKTLMATVQMAKDWNATYPQVGDTGADAPAGYITLWADFFTHGNLRLPVTVFVAEVLEYYHLHISQLSPFGMFRIRNFEYTFRAYGLPISVENFRRFYQLTVNTGFFSFTQRHGSLKLMTPPKGVTGWKKRFFYVKACAVYANMSFRNVDVGVSDEDIPVASAETADWFSRLRPIELKKLDNDQLWILRMMLSRPDRKERPVLREQGGADAVGLWRMFEPDFKGQVELIAVELKKGFNLEILKNFRVPSKAVLEAPVPGDARGVLADLGKFEKRVPKKTVEKKTVKKTVRGRGKGSVESSAAPSSVFEAAESRDAGYSFGEIPASPPHTAAAGAGVLKEKVAPKEPAAPFAGPAEVQAREVAVTDLNARVSVAENRADAAVEAKDALAVILIRHPGSGM
ncbi:uncharacterized protein LOC118485020 [Helianthus annuus]|uniref:uncharacterized protein LOC118485020 n=1 Tax=Helianthus annuus TaxID=4232 RepID=UPI001652C21A|nr:uncharacterized protein LOC118485020 [Helianthus annuus]